MPYKKPVTYISGLIAGFLLFFALLAVQLNSVIFNAGFQQTAIGKLNIYERLVAAPDMSFAKSGDIPFETAFKNSITPDLLNKNVKSLIDGLIDYVSGRTHNLPDLYIAGADKLSIATSAGVTPAAVEKINLQLIMMFSSEQNLNDILSAIGLIQFILAYLPPFFLLLCSAVALAAAASRKSPPEILGWMGTAVLTFFMLCLLSAWLIGSIPLLIPMGRLSGLPGSEVTVILADYIRYCSGGISSGILLSGLILPAGMRLADFLCGRLNKRVESGSPINFSSEIPVRSASIPVLLVVTAIYSMLAFSLVTNTVTMFHKRNLGHAVSYVMGNLSYNRYTDARNEDVCLLNIKLLNENDKTPVRNMQATVYPLDYKSGGKVIGAEEAAPEKTDEDGSVSFILSEGEFRLELYPSDCSDYEGQTVSVPLSYDLSLYSAGRTELTVILGSEPIKPIEPAKPSEPGTTSEPAKPSEPGKSVEPSTTSEPLKPSEPGKSSEPSTTSEPLKPSEPGKSFEPSTTSVPATPQLKIVDASMQYMP